MDAAGYSEKLLALMLAADRAGAAEVIGHALDDGVPPQLVVSTVLDSALVRIGELWERESASLAQTFVAAKIAEDVMQRCLPAGGGVLSPPPKGRVVIGNIEDDFHSLGRRIVATFLQATGWAVSDLGNDVVAELFVDKAVEVNAAVVGASAMTHTTALNIRKLRDAIDQRGLSGRIRLAVGGAVFNWRPELVAEVGADGTAKNAAGADELCTRLQAAALASIGGTASAGASPDEGGPVQ